MTAESGLKTVKLLPPTVQKHTHNLNTANTFYCKSSLSMPND